jgi:hypothetical protein
MADMDSALVSLYSRLQHLQWSLLSKQRHISQVYVVLEYRYGSGSAGILV